MGFANYLPQLALTARSGALCSEVMIQPWYWDRGRPARN